jgi:hypothetical protein
MSDWTSIYCPHCRRHTSLREAPVEYECTGAYSGKHKYTTGAVWKKDYNEIWWIGVCNSCREPVLVLNKGDIIYPQPLPSPTDDRIPELIRNDLNEAKFCYSVKAYRASAVMSRRAMQSACLDKGATKEKLVAQLHELAANGVITNDLKEWADVVRWVGNDAAHPDKQAVTEKDAEDMLNLAEQFLHVIYVAPAIAKEQRTKRGK